MSVWDLQNKLTTATEDSTNIEEQQIACSLDQNVQVLKVFFVTDLYLSWNRVSDKTYAEQKFLLKTILVV